MNIIYARMQGYDWVSTPSDAVARELENLGHKVTVIESLEYIPPEKYDFVWSPYESVTILGEAISQQLNIPHFSHIEWFPPWRIKEKCNVSKYGFQGSEPELQNINNFIIYYKRIFNLFQKAKIKTIGSKEYINYITNIYKSDKNNIKSRFPSIDYSCIQKTQKVYSPKRIPNRIISIARLVPNKRYDLVVKVLNKLTIPVEWYIIGDGPQKEKIKQELTNPKVKLVMLGHIWGWNKFYMLLTSKVFIGSWNGMPPVEAELLGNKSVLIRPENTNEINIENVFNELFGEYIYHNTDTQKVADKLQEYLESSKHIDITEDFLNNKLGIISSKQNAKNIIEKAKNEI